MNTVDGGATTGTMLPPSTDDEVHR